MFKVSLIVVVVFLASALGNPTATIAPSVAKAINSHGSVDIVLNFHQKTAAVLQRVKAQSFASRGARINSVANTLRSLASTSQKSILAFLAHQEVASTSFWISNQIAVKGATAQLVHQLATFPEIESIVEDKVVLAPLPTADGPSIPATKVNQWGVEMVGAPEAWAQGFNGNDVVVGMLDSGVRYTHNVLRSNYREDRGWLDASSEASPTPIDGGISAGHGTHVMGSIVGTEGVGVAPGAKWIACKTAMEFSSISEYQKCGEFFLCPTHSNGSDPDCSVAPHVVSHSWGFLTHFDHDFMDASIMAWNAAGIFVVWANGNEGPKCGSTRYPANTAFDMFTVGATNGDDELTRFSSRGPGIYSGVLSPNIAAPGNYIMSASHFDDVSLARNSGTSMAAPHVAGVIALLLTNGTELSYGELSSFIFSSAAPLPPTGSNCGDIPETEYPNNAAGHGRISASGAISRLLESRRK